MSKKGVSFEEKKTRMLQIFYEKKEFFQMKELERIAPKEKGITVNSVKEVVEALVDEGSIDTDKIGGSIYFWAFPSKVFNLKKRRLEQLQQGIESSTKKLKIVTKTLQEAQSNKENTEDSTGILNEIGSLEVQVDELKRKVQTCRDNNSDQLEEMEKQVQPLKEAANRWTDNIFEVKTWCKKKFMIEDKILNKQFGIPEDLDYLE